MASGPGDFQRKMEECLRGVSNTAVYLDNVYCSRKNHTEDIKRNTRLQQVGLKVNASKCEFFKEKIQLLDFIIDRVELHKSPSKIKTIIKAPRPLNAKQLSSFLGLVTYYARFLPNRAKKLKSLYDYAKENQFH